MNSSLIGYNGLQRLFWTSAFQGNMSWISKLGWIGGYVSDFISIFCILALFMLAIQIVFTLIYFSAPEFWRNVHDIKQQQVAVSGRVNIAGISEKTFVNWNNGSMGGKSQSSGLDVIVDLLYILVPDMIRYSDYNPDFMAEKLKDDDTLGRWLLISFPKKVFLMFILSFAFSGGLWQTYGQCIAVASVLANDVISQNFVAMAQKEVTEMGGSFNTTLGQNGTEFGKTQADMFNQMYATLIANGDVTGGQAKQEIGIKLQQLISSKVTPTFVGSLIHQNTGQKLTEQEIQNFNFKVFTNTSSSAEGGWTVPFTTFMTNTSSSGLQQYIHVYFSASKPLNMFNYKIKTNATPNGINTAL